MSRRAGQRRRRLYVEAHGAGPPILLLLRLLNTTRENFRPQVDAAGRRRLPRACSGTTAATAARTRPTIPPPTRIDQVVDDLGRVLDWARARRARRAGRPLLRRARVAPLRAARIPSGCARCVLIDSGPGFKNPEAQARWQAQVERTARFLETRGCGPFVESRAAATAIGRRPELPAARAAPRRDRGPGARTASRTSAGASRRRRRR